MSKDGRYYVVDKETGRKFCVEPLSGGNKVGWGDVDPATKKLSGSYGEKHKGTVDPKDSIITEENGFKDIVYLEPGESPDSYIRSKLESKKTS